jgi:hypothetical protein
LVLATREFFPDPSHGTDEDVRRLLDRVSALMDVDPASVELAFYDDSHPMAGSHLLTNYETRGAAGVYESQDGVQRIWIEAGSLSDPIGLVATLAHELGHVRLIGEGRISGDEEDHEPLTDLLTVYLSLGVITANSVVRESSWSAPQSEGWSVGRRGYLDMPAYGYALALFARARGEDDPAWAGALRPDVRGPFREAMRFLAAPESGSRP